MNHLRWLPFLSIAFIAAPLAQGQEDANSKKNGPIVLKTSRELAEVFLEVTKVVIAREAVDLLDKRLRAEAAARGSGPNKRIPTLEKKKKNNKRLAEFELFSGDVASPNAPSVIKRGLVTTLVPLGPNDREVDPPTDVIVKVTDGRLSGLRSVKTAFVESSPGPNEPLETLRERVERKPLKVLDSRSTSISSANNPSVKNFIDTALIEGFGPLVVIDREGGLRPIGPNDRMKAIKLESAIWKFQLDKSKLRRKRTKAN